MIGFLKDLITYKYKEIITFIWTIILDRET
jgi:hypothetical protein